MKRVIVTGATGFMGRAALPALIERSYEVHAVSRLPGPAASPGITWHQADLFDADAPAGLIERIKPTHLLHFAWDTSPGKYWTSVDNLSWLAASLKLTAEFAARGGQRLVTAGTCAEYSWDHGVCIERRTPLEPATLYGTAKHALRLVSEAFAATAGLSAAWGRVFYLFGPHENSQRLVPSVVRALMNGRTIACSHGEQVRDFLYVQDVADAFAALLDGEVSGPVNIASGEPVKIKDIILRLADMIGADRALIKLGEVAVPANDPELLLADIRRLRDEVGWSPKYTLTAGLEQTIDWYKKTGCGP